MRHRGPDSGVTLRECNPTAELSVNVTDELDQPICSPSASYYGTVSTGRPIDGQAPQNLVIYTVLRGLPVGRSARR
jgi:hypothetical protein